GGEAERSGDVLAPERGLVGLQHTGVTGEHEVEQPRAVDEAVEVDRILLVPEDGRNAAAPAGANQVVEGALVAARVACHLEVPRPARATPGRLDQEQIRPAAEELKLPEPGVEEREI